MESERAPFGKNTGLERFSNTENGETIMASDGQEGVAENHSQSSDGRKEEEGLLDKTGRIAGLKEKLGILPSQIEQRSSISRHIGSPEAIQRVLSTQANIFKEQKELEHERPKTPEELRVLAIVQEATNALREKYGLPAFNIPEQNIHVIKRRFWENPSGTFYTPESESITIGEESTLLAFAKKCFHEMVHMKGHNASQQIRTESFADKDTALYRTGFLVYSRKRREHFRAINEAITEELTKRFISAKRKDISEKETAETEETLEKMRGERNGVISDKAGQATKPEDIFVASIARENLLEKMVRKVQGKKKPFLRGQAFTYEKERACLSLLIEKIMRRSDEDFEKSDEIFYLFAEGAITGNILPAARAIDKAFGEGTFRRIGECNDDVDELAKYIESLASYPQETAQKLE